MLKDVRLQTSFLAQDEEGKVHRLDVWVKILDAGGMGHADSEVEGLIQIKTRDGDSVKRLHDGKYQVVQSGQILVSNDPKAP